MLDFQSFGRGLDLTSVYGKLTVKYKKASALDIQERTPSLGCVRFCEAEGCSLGRVSSQSMLSELPLWLSGPPNFVEYSRAVVRMLRL